MRVDAVVPTPKHAYHLVRGDVSTNVDGMPIGVRWVRGRALSDSHGEEDVFLVLVVHERVMHLHAV